jgi:hypothetical protein
MAEPDEAVTPCLQIEHFQAETDMTGVWHRTLDMSGLSR